MRRLIVALAAALGGCATTPVEIYGKDGKPALYTECPKTVRCHHAAREKCGGAYVTIDEQHRTSAVGVPTAGGFIMAPDDKTRLVFRCQ